VFFISINVHCSCFVSQFRIVLVIIVKLVIQNVMCMNVNEYLWLFIMLTSLANTCALTVLLLVTEQGQGRYRPLE
jgi:beta-lactamase regulating signal transducer with metallopeptidase domain